MRKNPLVKVAFGLTALSAAAVLAVGLSGCSGPTSNPHSDCTVTGKYVTYSSKSSSKRVETSCGVFTADDDLFRGHFNSADVYAGLQVHHTYNFVAYGERIPFFSQFPNIEAFSEVN